MFEEETGYTDYETESEELSTDGLDDFSYEYEDINEDDDSEEPRTVVFAQRMIGTYVHPEYGTFVNGEPREVSAEAAEHLLSDDEEYLFIEV